MPKIQASLADVSTKFELVEPGDYDFKIDEIRDTTKDGRESYLVITSVDQPGTDMHGRKVFHNLNLTKKDKTPNTAGMAELKRYFEAVYGEETVADPAFEYDTDELVNQRFHAEVVIESYQKNDGSGEGKTNRFKAVIPV